MSLSRVAGKAVSNPVIRRLVAPRVSSALRQNALLANQVLGQSLPENLEGKRPENDACSEAITYDLLMPIFKAVERVAGEIGTSSDMNFSGAIAYFRGRLEEMEATDPDLLERIDALEDPLARATLRMVIANKRKWLCLCAYLEEHRIDGINAMMKCSPDIMERISDSERQIIGDLLNPGDSPVIDGAINVARDLFRAWRTGSL